MSPMNLIQINASLGQLQLAKGALLDKASLLEEQAEVWDIEVEKQRSSTSSTVIHLMRRAAVEARANAVELREVAEQL